MERDDSEDEGAVRFQSEVPLTLPSWATDAVRGRPWQPLSELVVERCSTAVFPTQRFDHVFLESLTHSVAENVKALSAVLTGELGFDEVPLERRLAFASLEAEARVTPAAMQRSYRISFFLQWQYWSQAIASAGLRAGVGAAEATLVQQSVTAIVQAYADAVISAVALTFARSEEALTRSRAHVRQRLVHEILDGNGGTLSPADLVTLDYPLDAWHVAVLLDNVPVGAAGQLAVGLRTTVRQQHTVVHPLRLDTSMIWLGSTTHWSQEKLQRLVAALETAGVTASVSDTAPGLEGFLRVFAQAQQVESTRPTSSDEPFAPVIRYADVRLEILLLQDPVLAAEFLGQELGPLAEDTPEAAKLRATIDASFRLGSHVAAAEHLQLHEHTVRNRLARAQELLGPLYDRRTEIQVALRLWRLLSKR